MGRKIISDDKACVYEFTVQLVKTNYEYKVRKTYAEFVELESHIIQIIDFHKKKKHPILSKNYFNDTNQVLPSRNGY